MTSSTRTSTFLFAAFLIVPHALQSAGLREQLQPSDSGSTLIMTTDVAVSAATAIEAASATEAQTPASRIPEPHPQEDVFREPGPRIPASLDPRAGLNPEPAGPEISLEESPETSPEVDAAEVALSEKERFEQVYREIEQSFRARGASAEILDSLMKTLKQPIREATRGPASETNVVDVRKIDEVMRLYIENQDEDLTEDAD